MTYLPCPFCGSSSQEIYDLYYDGLHVVAFCKCGVQAGEAEDEEGAIALWNKRSVLDESSTSQERLSCPFCGGREQEHYQQGKYFWLWCKCGAQGSHTRDREGAIAFWNTRINNQALERH